MSIDLSIIIVAFNAKEVLKTCLHRIRHSKDQLNKEVIVVDNGSVDGTYEFLQENYPEYTLIKLEKNRGFVMGNNIAYEEAKGDNILLLNSDAFIGENTLQPIVEYMNNHKDCGVVGCCAENLEGEIVPSIRFFPTPWRIFLTKMGLADKLSIFQNINDMSLDHDKIQECDWVTGCCLFIKREVVDKLDFLLRDELYMYNDDNDLCLRVKKLGWKVIYYPERITHVCGVSKKTMVERSSDQYFKERIIIESEFIYFRNNYNVMYMYLHFFMIQLLDVVQILKKIILFKKNISIKECFKHMKFTFDCLVDSNFGKRSKKSIQ